MERDVLEAFRRPEYTGENRCLPCTVLNLVIAAVVAAVLGRRNRALGILAFAGAAAVIGLRGYLVPGTPTLTKRYLPPRVLRWFGKEPEQAVSSGFQGLEEWSASSESNSAESVDSAASESITVEPTTEDADDAGDGSDADERIAVNDGDSAASDARTDVGRSDEAGVDLETYFLERDVLEPCEEIDDLCLTDEFEDRWVAEIDAIVESDGDDDPEAADDDHDEAESGADDGTADDADDAVDAAAVIEAVGFGVDPEDFELETRNGARFLVGERGIAGRWPSHAAVVADVAASRALEEWVDDWDRLDPETKGRVLNALRMFLDRCPTGGAVEMGEEVVESCCTSHDVVAVTCEETGERLFEQRLDRVEG